MDKLNEQLYYEIEKLCTGEIKNIAVDIVTKLQNEFISEDRIKEDIRQKVHNIASEEDL